ncbi:MAG: sugar transferase [Candidatus Wildermuthbacteria bacterium]|nr:sugar transferase [Candidatus Wildermuthbacteria bacterium]
MVKRVFDFIAALFGFILIAPIFLAIAFAIKLDSSGPVFYKGLRVGKQGKEFRMFKFRSMVQNADKIGGPSTAGDDPRLTRMGKFLKKFQLDELPQLLNVIKGEMSIVGPRPEVPFYVDMMTSEERNVILSVRPGMTDWASLWNFHEGEILRGSADPEKTYQEKIRPEKMRLQMKYVRERNFLVDLNIILQTVLKIFQ